MKINTNLKILKGDFLFVPLIDVVFLLLIFFMLSSSFVEVSAIDISLPKVIAHTASAEKMIVTISKSGYFFFNDRPMTISQLKEALSRAVSNDKIGSIIVRADKNVTHGEVSRVLSIASQLGLTVYFAVLPPTSNSQIVFEKD